jgi:hypothetical protein
LTKVVLRAITGSSARSKPGGAGNLDAAAELVSPLGSEQHGGL